jgi:micrococcal nuclease
MNFKAKKSQLIRVGYKIVRIVDGDGIIVENIFSKKQEEVRLYGIDAPEIKPSRKLKQDEKETHIAGEFLMELGRMSFNHLKGIILIDEEVTLIQEEGNYEDNFGRTLAYVMKKDGISVGEKMIKDGFAKPYNKFFCEQLPNYQQLFLKAKFSQVGLFLFTNTF